MAVERFDKVMKALHDAAKRYFDSPNAVRGESVITGYTQRYALPVHEIDRTHVIGKWKYLEDPARENEREIGDIVRKALLRGVKLGKALLLGGLYLQRLSMKEVPVDTGALRASAFTRQE